MSRSVIGHALVTLLALAGTVAAAQAQSWQVGSAPTFLSGTYGADSRTDIFYAPITAKRIFRDGDLTLVFPFLCVRGAAGVTVVGDSPIRTGGAGATTTTVTTTTRPAASGTRRGSTTTSTRSTTADAAPATPQNACGIGDVVVRGRYYVVDEHAWLPTIAVRAHLKAPTADAERGLGTGRPDEGMGVEVTRSVGRGLSAMVDGGYTFIGEPEGLEFKPAVVVRRGPGPGPGAWDGQRERVLRRLPRDCAGAAECARRARGAHDQGPRRVAGAGWRLGGRTRARRHIGPQPPVLVA